MIRENSFYHYLNALFAKYHPDFLNQDQLKRNNSMKAAVAEIKQEYKSNLNQLGSALNVFADMLDQFNNQRPEYSVDLPARYFVVRRKPNLRQSIWQKRLRAVNTIFHSASARLAQQDEQLSDISLVAHLAFFASTCGGLSHPAFLVNLIDQVESGSLHIKPFNNQIHIELIANLTGATHCKVSAEEVIGDWRRWSPDAYSLSILIQILDRQASRSHFNIREKKTKTSERALFTLLVKEVAQQKTINHVSNLKQFCSVAPAVVESFEDSKLPNFYIEYAIGNISSSPLRRESMQCFIDKKIALFDVSVAHPQSKRSIIAPTKSTIDEQGSMEVDQLYREINEALKAKSKNPNRSSSSTVLAGLESLSEKKLQINGALIVKWLIFKLNTTAGVESLQTYRSTFVRQWLVFTHEVDISAIDTSGISVICDEIIQTGKTEKRKSARAIVLMDFMRFASEFGAAFPSECEYKSYADNFARTNIVTPLQQSLIRNAIRKNNSYTRLAEKYELMLILLVRLGLRIDELLKLQLNEIEDSEQCWFTIKYNYFGKNKSYNATRKIPAGLLLIDDEKTMFFSYLKKRRLKARSKENLLLFSRSTVSNEKFSYEDVNTNLSRGIKRVCGPYGVLHDLRHTAISTMQLVLAEFDDLIDMYTPYKRDQAAQIRSIMKNGSEQNIYWQLCKFAGHTEPSMTVKTYCHFTDILLHKYINNHQEGHTSSFWETLTGLNRKTLRRIAPEMIRHDEILIFLSLRLAKQIGNVSLVQSNHQASQTLTVQITAESCINALRAYDDGISVDKFVATEGLELEIVHRWINNAKLLHEVKTREGKKRLYPPEYHKLCPTFDNNPVSSRFIFQLITGMRQRRHQKKFRATLRWAINFVLLRATHTHSGIYLAKRAHCKKLLGLLTPLLVRGSRAVLLIEPLVERQNVCDTYWIEINETNPVSRLFKIEVSMDTVVHDHKKYPNGRATFIIEPPNVKKIKEQRRNLTSSSHFSTEALVKVFHILAVMFGPKELGITRNVLDRER